ncbi:MAG: putative diguanylate cyclase [Methanobacterium sp. PtaU1.Bin242]|nr:MAG: putative diguanylate cyclase [Methanobacterium sp. PtaU1.Bin242]
MEILNFSRDTFELIIAGTLREALTNFRKDEFDIIIIDMQLSDNRGIESFIRLYNQYPDTPLITLTDYSDEQFGLLTVEYGAQDYLIKGEFNDKVLIRSIKYAIASKKADKELKESKKLANQVLEAADLGYWDWNIKTGRTQYNPTYYTMLGYEPYELPQNYKTWKGLLHPDDKENIIHDIWEHVNNKTSGYEIDFRMRTKNGDYKWILSRGKVIKKDADGYPLRMIGTHMDITPRKQIEDSLRQNEKNYRTIFENTGTATIIIEKNRGISDVNSEAENITGFSKEEIIDKKKWTDFVIKEDQQRLEKYADLRKKDPDSAPRQYETRLVNAQGNIKDILVTIATIPGTGKQLASIMDITQRKKAEDKLYQAVKEWERTFHAVPDLIAIIDNNYRVLRLNKAMADSLGLDPDDCVGSICYNAVHGTGEPHSTCPHRQLLEDGFDHTEEIQEARLGGDFMISVSPLLDFEGKLIGSVHVARDITGRKKMEKELKNSLNEKDLLIKEIHHRVKNNLQIISSLLELQEEYVKEETAAVNVLKESQNRVLSMATIHEMLYQSKELNHINFADYIKTLITNLLDSYNKSHGVKSVINMEETWLNIETAIPLGLIISEIVSNSLKYAFPHEMSGVLTISLEGDNDDGYGLVIGDDGVGFPEELDFRNVKSSLGLRLVNTLVRQLDGSIELDRNQGTKFTIKFKRQKYKERI